MTTPKFKITHNNSEQKAAVHYIRPDEHTGLVHMASTKETECSDSPTVVKVSTYKAFTRRNPKALVEAIDLNKALKPVSGKKIAEIATRFFGLDKKEKLSF